MSDHDSLVEALSRSAGPVRPPAPSWLRATAWIALALPAGALAGLVLHRAWTDWSQPGAGWAMLDLGFALVVGAGAILTAFDLSIPGRRPLMGKWLPNILLVWLAANVAGLVAASAPVDPLAIGSHCYAFMVLASAPMVGLVILGLRRTRTLHPERTLATAGVGVAFLALALLTLCHSPQARVTDFMMHLAAGATIIVATVLIGRRLVAIR